MPVVEVGLSTGLVLLALELLVPLPPIVRMLFATLGAVVGTLVVGSAWPVIAVGTAAMIGLSSALMIELIAVAGDAQRVALLGRRRT